MTKKLIHAYTRDPSHSLFKENRNDKATTCKIYCTHSDQCGFYAQGQCRVVNTFSSFCPYGKKSYDVGFTKRSKQFYDWISEQEKKYNDVGVVDQTTDRMTIVGEYICLPYTYLDLTKIFPEMKEEGVILATSFLRKDHFNIDTVSKIVEYTPRDMWYNQEIVSYQQEQIPAFLCHLSEFDEHLFNQIIKLYPDKKPKSNIGRKAYLVTLNPCNIVLSDNEEYVWDGTSLRFISDSSKFMLWSKLRNHNKRQSVKEFNLEIVPNDDVVVEVVSEDQINENTKFLD